MFESYSQPDGYCYSRFCKLYRRWKKHQDVVLRQDHRPGEKLFLDWAGATSRATQSTADTLDTAIDRLTDALEAALDWDKARAAGLPLETPCAP